MLKIQFKDNHRDPMWIMEKNFSIGFDDKNHLSLKDPSVAPSHAKLSNLGDKFVIKDIANAGVFVNGQQVTQKNVSYGDTVGIGNVEFVVLDPTEQTQLSDKPYWSLIADSNWLTGQEFPIVAGVGEIAVIGRNSECDIIFPGTHLSRKHASILVGRDTLQITDLGSANGTFLNEELLKCETEVRAGDRLRFDVYSFKVFGPGIDLPAGVSEKIVDAPSENLLQEDSSLPKRWKTRPTSPGNRVDSGAVKRDGVVSWLLAGGILLAFTVLAIKLFF